MRFFFQRWSGFIRWRRAPSGSLGGSGRTRWLASALSQGPQRRAALHTKLFFGRGSLRASVFLQGWGALLAGEAMEGQEQGSPRGLAAAVGSPLQAPAPLTDQQGAFEPEALPLPVAHALLWPVGSPPPGIHTCERLLSLARPTAQLLCVHTEWAQRITHFLHLLLRRPSPEASSHLPKQPPSTLLLSSLTRCPQAVKSGGGGGAVGSCAQPNS